MGYDTVGWDRMRWNGMAYIGMGWDTWVLYLRCRMDGMGCGVM